MKPPPRVLRFKTKFPAACGEARDAPPQAAFFWESPMICRSTAALLILLPAFAVAADPPAVKLAASKVTQVTVYQNSALVTRDVAVPEAQGVVEVIVSPLPPATVLTSLYAEGGTGMRVL